MNKEIEPILIGETQDIDQNSVENFEHEEVDYAIYHLKNGFFLNMKNQTHCSCLLL